MSSTFALRVVRYRHIHNLINVSLYRIRYLRVTYTVSVPLKATTSIIFWVLALWCFSLTLARKKFEICYDFVPWFFRTFSIFLVHFSPLSKISDPPRPWEGAGMSVSNLKTLGGLAKLRLFNFFEPKRAAGYGFLLLLCLNKFEGSRLFLLLFLSFSKISEPPPLRDTVFTPVSSLENFWGLAKLRWLNFFWT